MKIDITLWDSPERMRKTIKDLAKIILSLTAMNIFTLIYYKSWIVMGINILFFITTIPVIISKRTHEKQPPKHDTN